MTQAASNPTEMQLTVIALILGGIFEFFPRLRAGFLEAQSWWVPGVLERIDLILHEYKEADAPFLSLGPLEYWQRNCFSGIESGEPSLGAVVQAVGAGNLCVSTDFPHHDSNFPNVSNTLLSQPLHHPGGRRCHPLGRRPPLRLHRAGVQAGRRGRRQSQGGAGRRRRVRSRW